MVLDEEEEEEFDACHLYPFDLVTQIVVQTPSLSSFALPLAPAPAPALPLSLPSFSAVAYPTFYLIWILARHFLGMLHEAVHDG